MLEHIYGQNCRNTVAKSCIRLASDEMEQKLGILTNGAQLDSDGRHSFLETRSMYIH